MFAFLPMASICQQHSHLFTLSGTIQNERAEPLSGASIYIPDLKKGTVSDSLGHYKLSNIPAGNFLVEIKYIGFQTIIENIHFMKNEVKHFTMQTLYIEQNEIVITGTSRATSIKKNPIPIVMVNKKYLQQNLSTNIIDALTKVPGVSAVSTGPNISKPFIRGLGFNRMLTLYDGIRQEGQQWGEEHGIEVDENTIDKVELVKGPASLIYGSDAMAGVINLIPPNAPLQNTTTGQFLNQYHTNNRMIENSISFAGHPGNYTWGFTLSHKMATNYKNNIDGRVYNTGFAETNASASFGIHQTWGNSKFGISMYDNLQEVPSGKRDSATRKFMKLIDEENDTWEIVGDKELNSYKISDIHQHVQHFRFYNSSTFLIGTGRLGVNLAFQKSRRREYENPKVKIPGLFLDLNSFIYDAKYYFHEVKGINITAGVNGMFQNNKVEKGTEFIIPSYTQLDVGPFVHAQKSLGKLEIAGGIRFDLRHFKNADLYVKEDPLDGFKHPVYGNDTIGAHRVFDAHNNLFAGVSGSLGVTYKLNNQWNFKMNLGRGYRAPNVSEITSNGVHPGTKIYQIGNPDFKPEFNLQEDIGITFQSKHVTINLDIFNNDIQNYIYNQRLKSTTGEDSVIVSGNQTYKYVAAAANLFGGELRVDFHPASISWLHFENAISVVYGTNKGVKGGQKLNDSSRYLPFIPPLHTLTELRGDFKNVGNFLENVFVKFQFEWYGNQDRVYLENNTETPTAGYQLFNAAAGFDITNKRNKTILNFSLFANNLFDVAYQSHLSRLKYFEDYPDNHTGKTGIYNMGRNFGIKILVPFSW